MASNWPPKARDVVLWSCVLVCPLAVFNLAEEPVLPTSLCFGSVNLPSPTMRSTVPVSSWTREGH
eukprot:11802048-Heterocapsa_arctica.AAC.1